LIKFKGAKQLHSKVRIDSAEGNWILKSQLCTLIQKGMPEEFRIPFPNKEGYRASSDENLGTFTGFDLCLIAEGKKFHAHKVRLESNSVPILILIAPYTQWVIKILEFIIRSC